MPFAPLLERAAPGARDASPEAAERLQSYARFVNVIAEQLQALRERDLERFNELARERSALEAELEKLDAELGPRAHGSLMEAISRGIPGLLGEELVSLDARLHADEALEAQWADLEDQAFRAARTLGAASRRPGEYTPDAPEPAQRTRLDVRF